MNKLTVKELKRRLNKFNDDDIIELLYDCSIRLRFEEDDIISRQKDNGGIELTFYLKEDR